MTSHLVKHHTQILLSLFCLCFNLLHVLHLLSGDVWISHPFFFNHQNHCRLVMY